MPPDDSDEFKRILDFSLSLSITKAIQFVGFQTQPCHPYFDCAYPIGHIPSFSPDSVLSALLESRSPHIQQDSEKLRTNVSTSTHCLLLFDIENALSTPVEVSASSDLSVNASYCLEKSSIVRLAIPMSRMEMNDEEMEAILGPSTKQFVKSKLSAAEELVQKKQKCFRLHILRSIKMYWKDPASNRKGRIYFHSFSVNNSAIKEMSRPYLQFSYVLDGIPPEDREDGRHSKISLPESLQISKRMGYISDVLFLKTETFYQVGFRVKNVGRDPISLQLNVLPSFDEHTLMSGVVTPSRLAHRMCYVGSLHFETAFPLPSSQSVTHTVAIHFLFPGIYYFSFACTNSTNSDVFRSPSIIALIVNE